MVLLCYFAAVLIFCSCSAHHQTQVHVNRLRCVLGDIKTSWRLRTQRSAQTSHAHHTPDCVAARNIHGVCPVLFDAYVPVNDDTLCWFSHNWPLLRLINLIPLSIYMALSLVLLCYTWCTLRSFEVAAASRRTIVCRLVCAAVCVLCAFTRVVCWQLWFVGVFVAAFFASVVRVCCLLFAVFNVSFSG